MLVYYSTLEVTTMHDDDYDALADEDEREPTDFSDDNTGDYSLGERLNEAERDLERLSSEVLALVLDIEAAFEEGLLDEDLYDALSEVILTAQEVSA